MLFFIGKGGVGKTTSSAATAVALAERGYRTLIVSLDPAHNLGDVFMVKLSDRPKKIAENLYASELDMEGLIKAYLKHLEESMKHTYRYLTVINLEKYFEVLRYSPGIEEYATLEAVREILERGDEWDVIVFDTPPTGLTLRVL
ncbi:MAG: ArsA family ATPase, partial [Thermococcus sp.]